MKTKKKHNGLNNDKRNKNIRWLKNQIIKQVKFFARLWSVDTTFII